MVRSALPLLLGLLGGVLGALGLDLLRSASPDREAPPPAAAAPAAPAEGGGDLAARLEAVEEALGILPGEAAVGGPRLVGRGEGEVGPLGDEATQALLRAVEARAAEAVERRWQELRRQAEEAAPAEEPGEERPRLPLAEVAREVGLSAGEEDALRRIYEDTQEKMLALVAGEDGDVEEVRRDLEAAARDERQRSLAMAKYLPRVLPRIGEVIGLEMEKRARVLEAVGPEKASLLEGYDVVEENPFGLGVTTSVGVEAREER